MAFTAAYYVPATALLIWWVIQTRRRNNTDRAQSPAKPIPTWTLTGVLILIWPVGYAISIPPEIHLANTFLLTLYTAYLLFSLILLSALWIRHPRQP